MKGGVTNVTIDYNPVTLGLLALVAAGIMMTMWALKRASKIDEIEVESVANGPCCIDVLWARRAEEEEEARFTHTFTFYRNLAPKPPEEKK